MICVMDGDLLWVSAYRTAQLGLNDGIGTGVTC